MEKKTSRLTLGILAHVDSGKTTLSESILYEAGITKRQGRVDKGDAFLDNHQIERNRGITVFSKEAHFCHGDREFFLIDTPGHMDFSGEMERCLKVLDLAVLIISASEGISGRTENIWKLLARYEIPTFIFVNKIDLPAFDREALKKDIGERLTGLTFEPDQKVDESLALGSEKAMEEFLESDTLSTETLADLTASRQAFPLYFGSALNDVGVRELMEGLSKYSREKSYGDKLKAICYKISRDDKGTRLSHLKITGGALHLKERVEGAKVNEIRIYQGQSFDSVAEAEAGTVCSVAGLDFTYPGCVIGGKDFEREGASSIFYQLKTEAPTFQKALLEALDQLKEELASMEFIKRDDSDEILVGLMGTVQKETFIELLKLRYGIEASLGEPVVIYLETVKKAVTETVYPAKPEIMPNLTLTLTPAEDVESLTVDSSCREDQVDMERQGELVRELKRRLDSGEIAGILTGKRLSGIDVTISSGRGSIKHLKNGDLQSAITEAFYRALAGGNSLLMEPYFTFAIDVNQDYASKVMSTVQELGGRVESTELAGNTVKYRGKVPVVEAIDLSGKIQAVAKGEGSVLLTPSGYGPCHNEREVIERTGYHIEIEAAPELPQEYKAGPAAVGNDELKFIFDKTYGSKGKRPGRGPKVIRGEDFSPEDYKYKGSNKGLNNTGKPYLIVDGYNIIYAWQNLNEIASDNLGGARDRLIEIMGEYSAFTGIEVMIVFDGYKTDRRQKVQEKVHGVTVVFTPEGEIADHFIEKMVVKHADDMRITVATSDRMEQMMVFSQGAQRLSARDLEVKVAMAREEINKLL